MERVRIGIAAIPARTDALRQVIDSLLPQADEIYVSLNGFEHIPDFLRHRKVVAVLAPNLGDFQKFTFLEGFSGYYITCDDDIVYGPGFVDTIIDTIERYDRKVAVGWHGSVLKLPFSDYYDKESRAVYTFRSAILADRFVDVLGTGCMGFHTDTICPPMSLFERPSMADVYFAKYARERGVPLILAAHAAAVLTPIETDSSISGDSIANLTSTLNVRENVNALTAELLEVPYNTDALPLGVRPPRVGILGRLADGRWLKGGIFKSCQLMSRMLKAINWETVEIEIDSSFSEIVKKLTAAHPGERLDALIIYTGDQGAQDFYAVEYALDTALEMKIPTVVNLSIDMNPSRTAEIIEMMNSKMHDENLYLMAFTQEIIDHEDFRPIRDRMLYVPKTILTTPQISERAFHVREGIFLGDIAKLSNERLTSDAMAYLQAIRDTLGAHVPLYCVEQYYSEDIDPDIRAMVNVLPYQDNVLNLFQRFRIYVHLQRYCTFEMLPVEAMSSGLPVAYIDMPQSLNEYIGICGLRFTNPQELASKMHFLYNNPVAWKGYSEAGIHKAISVSYEKMAGALGLSIWNMIERAKQSAVSGAEEQEYV